jgi:hypothetical protein
MSNGHPCLPTVAADRHQVEGRPGNFGVTRQLMPLSGMLGRERGRSPPFAERA